ncbi:MAG TPA: hypothetical protein PKD05_18605 [Candidatus Melainabacteria bacterium]|nr:hypothetical protein [Candidatus Melainabacteria bacterium]
MNSGANKLFGVISESHEFLSWLHNEEDPAIKEMPEEFKESFKQLDKLGIVYKRNNRSLGIRWQRLRKLIERDNTTGAALPYEPEELLQYFDNKNYN